jgi:hypothetical protein
MHKQSFSECGMTCTDIHPALFVRRPNQFWCNRRRGKRWRHIKQLHHKQLTRAYALCEISDLKATCIVIPGFQHRSVTMSFGEEKVINILSISDILFQNGNFPHQFYIRRCAKNYTHNNIAVLSFFYHESPNFLHMFV